MTDRAPLLALVSGVLLVISSGCEDLTRPPYSAPVETDGAEQPTFPVEDSFPPIAESSVAYRRVSPDSRGALSRYVLDTTDVFELHYLSPANGLEVHPGTYVRVDSMIEFDFSFWPRGNASGVLTGDRLHVTHDVVLQINAGFEDGTYVRR